MTAPRLGMSGQQWTMAMAYYSALWPASVPTDASADAWRAIYGHLALDDVINALKMLAGQLGRRYGPAAGEVLEAAAAIDKARLARTDAYKAPSPAPVNPHEQRNMRRSRVIGKLAMGALNRDGSPTPGFEDDPDLWDDVDDPLIAQMRQAHLDARNTPTPAARPEPTDAELAADPAYADEIAAGLANDDPRTPDTPAVRAARRERGRRRAEQIRATLSVRDPGTAARVDSRVARTVSLVDQTEPAGITGARTLTHCGDPHCPWCTPPRPHIAP